MQMKSNMKMTNCNMNRDRLKPKHNSAFAVIPNKQRPLTQKHTEVKLELDKAKSCTNLLSSTNYTNFAESSIRKSNKKLRKTLSNTNINSYKSKQSNLPFRSLNDQFTPSISSPVNYTRNDMVINNLLSNYNKSQKSNSNDLNKGIQSSHSQLQLVLNGNEYPLLITTSSSNQKKNRLVFNYSSVNKDNKPINNTKPTIYLNYLDTILNSIIRQVDFYNHKNAFLYQKTIMNLLRKEYDLIYNDTESLSLLKQRLKEKTKEIIRNKFHMQQTITDQSNKKDNEDNNSSDNDSIFHCLNTDIQKIFRDQVQSELSNKSKKKTVKNISNCKNKDDWEHLSLIRSMSENDTLSHKQLSKRNTIVIQKDNKRITTAPLKRSNSLNTMQSLTKSKSNKVIESDTKLRNDDALFDIEKYQSNSINKLLKEKLHHRTLFRIKANKKEGANVDTNYYNKTKSKYKHHLSSNAFPKQPLVLSLKSTHKPKHSRKFSKKNKIDNQVPLTTRDTIRNEHNTVKEDTDSEPLHHNHYLFQLFNRAIESTNTYNTLNANTYTISNANADIQAYRNSISNMNHNKKRISRNINRKLSYSSKLNNILSISIDKEDYDNNNNNGNKAKYNQKVHRSKSQLLPKTPTYITIIKAHFLQKKKIEERIKQIITTNNKVISEAVQYYNKAISSYSSIDNDFQKRLSFYERSLSINSNAQRKSIPRKITVEEQIQFIKTMNSLKTLKAEELIDRETMELDINKINLLLKLGKALDEDEEDYDFSSRLANLKRKTFEDLNAKIDDNYELKDDEIELLKDTQRKEKRINDFIRKLKEDLDEGRIKRNVEQRKAVSKDKEVISIFSDQLKETGQ